MRILNDPANVDMSTSTPGYKGPIVNDPTSVAAPAGHAIVIDGTPVDCSPRTLAEAEAEIAAWRTTFATLDARRGIPRVVRR